MYPATVTDFGHTQGSSSLLESMAEEPQQQRDNRAARKQQLNGQIRAGVACELNQCVHDEGMLSAVRIPLISDHDRFVARLFRVQVNFKGAVPSRLGCQLDGSLGITKDVSQHW